MISQNTFFSASYQRRDFNTGFVNCLRISFLNFKSCLQSLHRLETHITWFCCMFFVSFWPKTFHNLVEGIPNSYAIHSDVIPKARTRLQSLTLRQLIPMLLHDSLIRCPTLSVELWLSGSVALRSMALLSMIKTEFLEAVMKIVVLCKYMRNTPIVVR